MGYGVDILNAIRDSGSPEYQTRIPVATQNNIQEVGNALQTYSLLFNEFCNALVNKIGKTILESKLFSNRLARFKSGTIMTGQDVEEIFIEMAKSEGAYDPDGKNPLGRRRFDDTKVIYHRMNRQDKYVITIGDMDFVRVFRSEATLETYIREKINQVYSGANYDEWLAMKNLISTYDKYFIVRCLRVVDTHVYFAGNPTEMNEMLEKYGEWIAMNEEDGVVVFGSDDQQEVMRFVAKDFVKRLRKVSMDMTFPSTQFNGAGVMTWCNPEDTVLLINKDLLTEVDVEVLSKAFNMGKTDIQVEIIPMDGFEPLAANNECEGTYGVLVDKDWFRVYDILSRMEPQRNADGLFTNYFYHVWQILSASTFKNAVAFCC